MNKIVLDTGHASGQCQRHCQKVVKDYGDGYQGAAESY